MEILDGFLIYFTINGEILYVSETISIYLGLSQVDVTGNRIEHYIHPDDVQRFSQFLSMVYYEAEQSSTNLRIKSTLAKRITKESLRSTIGFKASCIDERESRASQQTTSWRTMFRRIRSTLTYFTSCNYSS
ncbi:unnamed protein product [Gongylonema pulchrum]|uniref:PAS domain-containing protein n=1 Tax=Gongylonema pulchrum TaxID=637853 RepID=A0A3P7P2V5_9BILA|nr:unnamed protein product [Gongylonema pulchrum]